MLMEEFGCVGLPGLFVVLFVSLGSAEQQKMQNFFSSRVSRGDSPLVNPSRTQKLLANTRQRAAGKLTPFFCKSPCSSETPKRILFKKGLLDCS